MTKIASITKKNYYTVQINPENGNSFFFNVEVTDDGDLFPLDESDYLIIQSMLCEDYELSKELFAEISKQIKRIPD